MDLNHSLVLHYFPITSSPGIIVLSVLISHLAPRPSPSILPALSESRIPVRADDPVIQASPINVPHGVLGVRTAVVLHEAEAAGSFLYFIQAHDYFLNVPAFTEEFVDLFLRGVKGQVPDIQSAAFL